MIEPRACSINDAAAALGVSRRHVERLVNHAELDSLKSGGRTLVIVASIDEYIERHRRC
ncbi:MULTISPECIES: helix-turn-helix domain-containing protein [unclassified Aeromicrobium]|uniref:helix-turn-helix domain-containing protein n=1 Tax=unclassified Aeromicrobium TaxID=2633570 RepID=UPI00396B3AF4